MSCYKHFTTKERESLLVLLKKGQKNSEIAKEPGRSPSIYWEPGKLDDSSENKFAQIAIASCVKILFFGDTKSSHTEAKAKE